MANTVSTILFNGQFWIALVERYEDDGSLWVGKYTFGSEPTSTDVLDFYLNKYDLLRFHACDTKHRINKKYSHKEIKRNTKKSFDAFREAQKKYLEENKKLNKLREREKDIEKYRLKCEKKKRKKRGH